MLPVKHSFQAWVSGSYYTNGWETFPGGGVELLPSTVTLQPKDGSPQFETNAVPGEISDWSIG